MDKIIKKSIHVPVMPVEALAALNIKPDGIYVDGTFGGGGHSKLILNKLNDKGRLLVIDLDPDAILAANELQRIDHRIIVFHGSFNQITEFCQQANINQINGILLDLGMSSMQLAAYSRGFSFSMDGQLDMRMDPTKGKSAKEWLATVESEELVRVLQEYGEERFAKKIASAIVESRTLKPINTTYDLVEIIKKSCPAYRQRNKHPATRTFQAIRIFINQELLNLQQALPKILDLLGDQARLVIISFHSLEDKIVKSFITKYSQDPLANNYALRKIPILTTATKSVVKLKKIGKFKPSTIEVKNNVRARSAIMRVAEKCA